MTDKEKKAQQILWTMAANMPGFNDAAREYSCLLSDTIELPDDFASDVLHLLSQELDKSAAVAFYMNTPEKLQHFNIDTVITSAAVITCALFLLSTHIKFEKDKNGKKYFKFEHNPVDTELLGKVLGALEKIINQ